MTIGVSRTRIPRVVSALTLAMAAGTAAAQVPGEQPDDGPVVVGENKEQYKWFELNRVSAEAILFGQFRKDKIKTQGQPTDVVRENQLRAATQIDFDSSIGHKNLLELSGFFQLGIEDRTTSSNTQEQHETPFTGNYDIEGLILGAGPAPLTLYTRRDEFLQTREFASAVDTTTTEHGAILELRSEIIPTRLQYFHREQDASDPFGQIDQHSTQDTFSLTSNWRITDHQKLETSYIFDHIDESQGNGFRNNYDRNDATVTHTATFGKDDLDSLRSSFRLYDISGEFEQNSLRLDEQLVLELTEKLENRYNLTLEDRTAGDDEVRYVTGNTILQHHLFDSLVSTGTLGGTVLEEPGEFHSDQWFVLANFDYTKKVPWGRLIATAGGGFDRQDNSSRGSPFLVRDESRTFVDPSPLIISRRNVVQGSVTVTALNNFPIYTVNIDYTAEYFPDRVELRRIVGGSIADGQTVLVSYVIGPEPASLVDTTAFNISVRYSIEEGWLNGLSVYTYYREVNNSADVVDPTQFVFDDIQEVRFGAEYKIGDFTLLAEQTDHQSTTSPYDLTRLSARYDRRLSRDSTLTVDLTRDQVHYANDDNTTVLNRATGRWTRRLIPSLDISLYLQYRDETDDKRGDSRGLEESIEINWQYRQTKVYGAFRNSNLDSDSQEQSSQTFVIGLNRRF